MRKFMRKTAVCLLTAAFILTVSGCGQSSGSDPERQETERQQSGTEQGTESVVETDTVDPENDGTGQSGNDASAPEITAPDSPAAEDGQSLIERIESRNGLHTLEQAEKKLGIAGVFAASALGIASPLCMYGTIPIAASFSKGGMKDDWLAAFMMSSVLLNPQLIIYSAALGQTALAVRIVSCFLCGSLAGVLVRIFLWRGKDRKTFFNRGGSLTE